LGEPVIIGVVYRPPSGNLTNFYSYYDDLLEKLPSSNVIISGDFNINLHGSVKSEYEDKFFGHGYTPLISIATHLKPGCTPSCIDNIFTNSYENVKVSGACENQVSHHFPIFCFFKYRYSNDKSHCTVDNVCPKYDYCETNLIKFKHVIESRLENLSLSIDETGFSNFSDCIKTSINDCFLTDPEMMKSRRNRLINPWITSGIIASIKRKGFLYKQWKKTVTKHAKEGDLSVYTKYKNYRRNLKYIISNAKKSHYAQKFEQAKGNSKMTWKVINEIRGKTKSSNKPSFIINSKLVNDRRDIANAFNQYFVSIAVNMNKNANIDTDGINILPLRDNSKYLDKRIEESI